MPLTTDWNGNILTSTSPEALWSSKGGLFTSSKGVVTYFPLPLAYRTAIPVVGTFTVTAATSDRPDIIAKMLYQSEDYWWLVLWMNGIIDPFAKLRPGDTLLIADLNKVNALLK